MFWSKWKVWGLLEMRITAGASLGVLKRNSYALLMHT
ncbi:hypothetical protein SPSYN_02849 [Sporotomaculum syntrophicum]|uniref:Uncharacterized protein n=1 Tax=Sporotomaculum syntrophicum TaxID=182264 RepID=A0A9D3AWL1_9FIRM|nr:hypothetical protein SPSYN_02849 [Sporotomaculum syntrophicum]